MSEKCNVVPRSGSEISYTPGAADTCNKCGECKELVFAGHVCSDCSLRLDKQWASATATDWILITTPGPNDKVHSAMLALRESLGLTKGRLPTGGENRGVPELVPVRYIYRNLTYAEMKSHWAMDDTTGSCRLGLTAPDETDQMKSALGKREGLAHPLLRPARVEEIAVHELRLRGQKRSKEIRSILEQWGFDDEYMPVEGVWSDAAEQRAGQAYNAIRTRLEQLGQRACGGRLARHRTARAHFSPKPVKQGSNRRTTG